MGEVIVFHKTRAEIHQDRCDFRERSDAAFRAISQEFDLIKAVLEGDDTVLAKAADRAAVMLAKAEAAKIKTGEVHPTGTKLAAWLAEFNKTNAEIDSLERRSERFNARIRKAQ
jgi:fructoselysine-6-P-deglycase FrlB-like protein